MRIIYCGFDGHIGGCYPGKPLAFKYGVDTYDLGDWYDFLNVYKKDLEWLKRKYDAHVKMCAIYNIKQIQDNHGGSITKDLPPFIKEGRTLFAHPHYVLNDRYISWQTKKLGCGRISRAGKFAKNAVFSHWKLSDKKLIKFAEFAISKACDQFIIGGYHQYVDEMVLGVRLICRERGMHAIKIKEEGEV